MVIFSLIVIGTILVSLSLWGVGRFFSPNDTPAAAVVRGWTIFLLACALAWFFRFPARYLAPVLWLVFAVGLYHAIRAQPRREALLGALGAGMIAAVFAFPFLKFPGLLAYAHWGTDQWGYAGVAKWLVDHSTLEIPQIDNRPGLDWVWYILTTKDRPLIYIAIASLSSALQFSTLVAYYVLPAALVASVFLSFFLEERPLGLASPWAKFPVCLALALQPVLFMHFQHQFLGGVVAGLIMTVLVVGVVHVQARSPGDPLFYVFALLLSVLLIGLYTVRVALVGMALLTVVFLFSHRALLLRPTELWQNVRRQPRHSLGFVLLLIGAGVSFAVIRTFVPEPLTAPASPGGAGHVWSHLGSIFGQTMTTPWYGTDDSPGWLNPIQHNPAGGRWGAALLGILGVFLTVQSWRWWRGRREIAPFLILAACAFVLYRAAPPQGSHWLISRSLPIFGAMLLGVAAASALGERRLLARIGAIALACLPLAIGVKGLAPYLGDPANRLVASTANRPERDDAWPALGFAYYYEDTRRIDWASIPQSFRAMTHYVPEPIRPKLEALAPVKP